MFIPVESSEYERKILLPFIIIINGIVFDVLTTIFASLYGIPEGNINSNPSLEFIFVTTAMIVGIGLYDKTKNELVYKILIILSFITFIPVIYNIFVMIYLFPF